MRNLYPIAVVIGLIISTCLLGTPAMAQWSAERGATVRNIFGPGSGSSNQCRGACGGGCPKTCTNSVSYECVASSQLRRIEAYSCGTNQGCRVHDDCLDTCAEFSDDPDNCATQCDADVVNNYGLESATSWATGGGPYDGKITFEYTRDAPSALEPTYRCPEATTRQCINGGACIDKNGASVEPIFDSYPDAGAGAMHISALRAGPACGDSVCEQSAVIRVTGADSCPGGSCTRYGMEFDYRNADPGAPLLCSTSTRGGDSDFIGDLLKLGGDASQSRSGGAEPANDDGMGQLLGMFGKVLASADSPEDVQISMVPFGPDGKPIESQRVGSTPAEGPPPVPSSIALPAASGHLFVPMYQLANASNSGSKERKITCTHKGTPVLEMVFHLNF